MKWIPGTAVPAQSQRKPRLPLNSRLETFGECLRRLRKAKSITQSQLSLQAKISRTSISHYERNRAYPQRHTLKRLASALQVSIGFFDANTPHR